MLGGAICAIIGAVGDVRSNRIPNWLTYGGLALALALRAAWGGWRSLEQGLLGILLGGGIFFVLFLVHGMGAGDAKLMAAVGAWVGLQGTLRVLIATALAGGVLAVVYMVFYKRVGSTFRNVGVLLRFHLTSGVRPHPELNLQGPATIRLPYGLAIAMGTLYLLISASHISGVIYGH
jgi:prepilin peptidase CpaA